MSENSVDNVSSSKATSLCQWDVFKQFHSALDGFSEMQQLQFVNQSMTNSWYDSMSHSSDYSIQMLWTQLKHLP